MAQKYTLYDFSSLFVLSLIWASSFIFIKVAVETLPPLMVVALRLFIACLFFLAYMRLKSIPFGDWLPLWRIAIPVSLTGYVLPYALISWSEQYVDSHLAAVMVGIIPLLAMLFAHFFTDDERLSWQRCIAILIGLTGITLFKVFEGMEMMTEHADENMMVAILPLIALFLAMVSYGVNILIGRRARGLPPVAVQGMASYVGFLVILPFALIFEPTFLTDGVKYVSNESLTATIVLGILNTALSSILFYTIIARSGVIFVSLADYVIPFFGVALGYLILDETIGTGTYIALPLITLTFIIMYRQAPKPKLKPAITPQGQ